jgi:hypothetical protein
MRFLFLLLLLLGACTPKIGDKCRNAAECVSTETDRLCLTEAIEGFPGGYCTVFNCQPGSCPSEATCIGYRASLANAGACADPAEPARLERNYCMRTCGSDSDCRGGYVCLDLSVENPWGAIVMEKGDRAHEKVCALAYSEPPASPERASDVCTWRAPSDASGRSEQLDAGMTARDAAVGDAAVVDAAARDAAARDAAARDAAARDAAARDAGNDAAPRDAAH